MCGKNINLTESKTALFVPHNDAQAQFRRVLANI